MKNSICYLKMNKIFLLKYESSLNEFFKVKETFGLSCEFLKNSLKKHYSNME